MNKFHQYDFSEIGKELSKADFKLEHLLAIMNEAPISINLLNSKFENIFGNSYCSRLFGLSSFKEYRENFYKFSPERQPNGKLSTELTQEYMKIAKKEGSVKFRWMHCRLDGELIPTEVFIRKLNFTDNNGNYLFASFVRDLRSELAGFVSDEDNNEEYFNQISDKTLLNHVSTLSDEWLWVYNFKESTIEFFGQGVKLIDIRREKQKFPDEVLERNVVFPEDVSTFLTFCKIIKTGAVRPFDVRFILRDGTVKYFRIIYNTTFDKDGNPLFAIGKTFDIDMQKTYEVLSKTDLLTNCLNKITTENIINETILAEKNSYHALFIVDIDNFKAVNDNLGHHFGDIVLKEIALELQTQFRIEDIVGRIGGDEFIVFVKNVSSNDIITSKAEAIAKAFQNNFTGENGNYKISGSIGISVFPKDGKTYSDLYKAADKALYHSKSKGKDCYTFYSADLADGEIKKLTTLENTKRLSNTYFDAEIVSIIFDIMYQSEDTSIAINNVLQLLGKRLNADRCYIFETLNKGESYSVTYEWTDSNTSKQIDNLQNFSNAQMHDFIKEIDTQGYMFLNDTNLIENDKKYVVASGQGIESFLIAQAKRQNYTRTIIGLDDCKTKRNWTEKEVNTVIYALKMISIFIENHANENVELSKFDLSEQEISLIKELEKKGLYLFEK